MQAAGLNDFSGKWTFTVGLPAKSGISGGMFIGRLIKSYQIRFNPQSPVAQKVADEVVFRRFQGEEVEFF